MIDVKISVDTSGVTRMLKGFEKQIPFALQTAINNTAFDVRKKIAAELAARLERPTRWTTGSVRVEKATKASLSATVAINATGKEGATQADLLRQQFTGGTRRPKQYEAAMRSAGLLDSGEYTVPGQGAKIDAYGNVRRSQLKQIFAALRGEKPGNVKTKAKARQVGTIFWADGKKGLRKGVWLRTRGGITALLLVVRSTVYQRRVPFHQIAREEFGRVWPANAEKAVAYAVRTAK